MTGQTTESERARIIEAAVRDAVASRADSGDGTPRLGQGAGSRRLLIVFMLVAWTGIAWIWSSRPAFLFGAPVDVAESPEVEAARLRFAMFLERSRVDQYVRRHGALPADLAYSGPVETGVTMLRTSEGFALTGERGTTHLRLTSAMDADSFLAGSLELLRRKVPNRAGTPQ